MTGTADFADDRTRDTGASPGAAPVPPLFWPAAAIAAWLCTPWSALDSDWITTGCLLLMLVGGLPHGAYDIATGRRVLAANGQKALLLLVAYITIALAMAGLWSLSPAFALAVFLLSAAMHFAQDWEMLDTWLLRATAGASVICIPAIFRPEDVSALFTHMGGAQGKLVSQIAIAAAPVAILVMLTALTRAFRQGDREWALAQATAFAGLALLPPALGFTVFFVFLHSPLHMREVRASLPDWPLARLAAYGMAICGVALIGGVVLFGNLLSDLPDLAMAAGFQFLSVVAAPHLVLHFFMNRSLNRSATSQINSVSRSR